MPPTQADGRRRAPQKKTSQLVEPIIAFYVLFFAHGLAALYAPIQDCDEVFNYWEPTHYLEHGTGLQTWEYSPVYAIRSWVYVGLHALPAKIGSLILGRSKVFEFYMIRLGLAFICAVAETRLFSAISRTFNPRVALFYLLISATSTGAFIASAAYLPSSFAMYATALGFTAFMDWTRGVRTAEGIMWFAIGAVLGWPFAAALVAPFMLEEVMLASLSNQAWEFASRILDGTVRSVVVVAIQAAFDTYFYRALQIVPWNIVKYNIFSGGSKGPNIYGTEPWHFYLRNLALNFNIWFALALAAFPLILIHSRISSTGVGFQSKLRSIFFSTPLYLWLTIFSLQPHKEERFMFPVYPALMFNAATSMHIILMALGKQSPNTLLGKIPAKVKLLFVSIICLAAIDLAFLRTYGLYSAYSAPLKVYGSISRHIPAGSQDFVCVGKEWYRYPSSYFLPAGLKPKFIKSEFSGLLPGEFSQATESFGFRPGTYLIPAGMNDENQEDPARYVDVKHCTYLVDSYFPGSVETTHEPHYTLDTKTWEKMECHPFLDAARSPSLARIFWTPDLAITPAFLKRHWGEYCLLKRRSS